MAYSYLVFDLQAGGANAISNVKQIGAYEEMLSLADVNFDSYAYMSDSITADPTVWV